MERSISYRLRPLPRFVTYGIPVPGIPFIDEGEPFEPAVLDAETIALPARLLTSAWQSVWVPLFPVVVFTGPGFGELRAEDRDLIWRRWGVPVYEQRLSASGQLLAEECDAHDVLHVREERWSAGVEQRRCACGYEGPGIAMPPTSLPRPALDAQQLC